MRRILAILGAVAAGVAYGQAPLPASVELANLREDVRGLVQRVGELTLKVEELERQNRDLQNRNGAAEKSFATLKQVDAEITEATTALKQAIAASKTETLQQVTTMMEKLGRQTNAAIDSLAKGMATRPTVQTVFSDDFPQEGIRYTVQAGDNIASIAKKTGAKAQDIVNANKLPDAGKIQVGQNLFIPGGK